MNNYTVYKHTSPSGKVYIGITSKNPIKRWNGGLGYLNNEYFSRAIVKYGWDNFKHEILFCDLSKEDAEAKEIELISLYRSDERAFGYNIQHGGSARGKHSEESKLKIGQANKGRLPWNTGKHRDDETKRKISESHKGMHLTEDAKRKISLANKGKKQGSEVVRKRAEACCKKIICIELGKEFPSVKMASELTNINKNSISACLNGRSNSAGGYHWEYATIQVF